MSLQARYRKYPTRFSFGPGSRPQLRKVEKPAPPTPHAPLTRFHTAVYLPPKGSIARSLMYQNMGRR